MAFQSLSAHLNLTRDDEQMLAFTALGLRDQEMCAALHLTYEALKPERGVRPSGPVGAAGAENAWAGAHSRCCLAARATDVALALEWLNLESSVPNVDEHVLVSSSEADVLLLIAQGLPDIEMAVELQLSRGAVEARRHKVTVRSGL